MIDNNKLKNFLAYFNLSAFFLVIFTYSLFVGVFLREILFSKSGFYFNSATIFFSNYNALLLPYVFASIVCFIIFFIYYNWLYRRINGNILKKNIVDNILFSIFLLSFCFLLVKYLFYGPVFSETFIIVTLFYGFLVVIAGIFLFFDIKTKYLLNIVISILLILITYEILNISFGKKFIMNEYLQIDEITSVEGSYVSNEKFLSLVYGDKILELYNKYKRNNRITLKKQDLARLDIEIIMERLRLNEKFDRYLINERDEEVKMLKNIVDFYSQNRLEYIHRNMNRGQIDHTSYVLSPINEYTNGKPLKEIYFQYGIGSAIVIKKIMELFGGISIGNYYKSYILYLPYFIVFILVFYKIFGYNFYFKTSILILILSFFVNSYVVLILAPGINPILHFMDVIVLFLLFRYYTSKNSIYLFLSFFSSILGIYLNLNYGLMGYLALIISLFFFFKENEYIKNNTAYVLKVMILFSLGFLFYSYLSKLTKSESFIYMIFGFFNFGYYTSVFTAILIYIVLGYISLAIFKNLKNEFKYLFIFYFIYSIELITYYMWSGLYDHINIPLTSALISFILAGYIYENYYFSFNSKEKYFNLFKMVFTLFLALFSLYFAKNFYVGKLGKINFQKIFKYHKTYQWTIDKSDFYSTISQDYFKDSLDIIKKYSKGEKGIYIISKFDVLLTFLTDKYSKMHNFTLGPTLFTSREVEKNIAILNKDNPSYIFVDNDLLSPNFYDPYSVIFDSSFNKIERYARMRKYMEMKKIFDACQLKYKLVEQGKLISVFKLKL